MSPRNSARRKSGRSHRQFDWTRCFLFLVAAAGLSVHLNSFTGVFVFDDAAHILQKDRIRQLWPPWEVIGGRRPVSDTTLAVNYKLGGLEVWGYHAVNVSVHVLAGLTLFGVVRRTLVRKAEATGSRAAGFSPREHSETRDIAQAEACGSEASWIALAVALIWAVHPLQTQSVTYLIQRCESMMGLFYLLTLYCVVRGADSARGVWWYGVAVVSCALGMGSKAVMVTAPLMVLLYDRVFLSPSYANAFRRRWGLYVGLAASWGVLWACGVAQGVLSPYRKAATMGFSFRGITPLEYALTQPGAILHYLGLSLWPHPLCLDYNWPVARTAEAVIPSAIVIVGLIAATVWALFRRPGLGFVGVWFFLILAPSSSFVPIKDTLFEHRMYLSLASVVVLVVVGTHVGLRRLAARLSLGDSLRRCIAMLLALAAITTLGYGTVRRNEDYHSAVSMWRDVVAKRPDNARAYENLGTVLMVEARIHDAIEAYRKAVQRDPDFASAHANLANALSQTSQFKQAAPHYGEVLRLDPFHVDARINLGHALDMLGRTEEGIEVMRAATQVICNARRRRCWPGHTLTWVLHWEGRVILRLRSGSMNKPCASDPATRRHTTHWAGFWPVRIDSMRRSSTTARRWR